MSERPRIAIVVTSFPTVSETFIVDHVLGMVERGWAVDVLCMRENRELRSRLGAVPGLNVHEIGAGHSPLSDPRTALSVATAGIPPWSLGRSAQLRAASYAQLGLRRALAHVRPDVVHAHFGSNGLKAAVAGARRLIVDFHGHDVTVVPRREGWQPYQHYLRGARAVVHSSFTEQLVGAHLDIPIHRVVLGVDQSRFAGLERKSDWGQPLRLLTVGRLVFQKGHQVALAALARLRNGSTKLDAQLTIVGGGPEANSLARYAESIGVADRVRFAGAAGHAQVAASMAEADLLLVPSVHVSSGAEEAFGRVAIEGMSCGLPVIVTRTGGLAEAVEGCGMSVAPDDPAGLAEAIRFVVNETRPRDWLEKTTTRTRAFGKEKLVDGYDSVARKALAS